MSFTRFSETNAPNIFSVQSPRLEMLMTRYCEDHFAFLSQLGFREAYLYGGALRDTVMKHLVPIEQSLNDPLHPRDFDYIVRWPDGMLPANGNKLTLGSRQVAEVYDRIMDKADMVETCQHKRADEIHFKFHLCGQTIDLGVPLTNAQHSFNQIANHGSIGLCSIAMDDAGRVLASERFRRDFEDLTLSISPDLAYHEAVRAEEKAFALQGRYEQAGVVLRLIIPANKWGEDEAETPRRQVSTGYSFP